MGFPVERPRRLRRTELLRALVRETDLSAGDLIEPLFVRPGKRMRQEIPSMPGQFNLSVDEAVAEGQEARSLGVPAVILFGIPPSKDARSEEHTSELQSRLHLVCRLLLEKKKKSTHKNLLIQT